MKTEMGFRPEDESEVLEQEVGSRDISESEKGGELGEQLGEQIENQRREIVLNVQELNASVEELEELQEDESLGSKVKEVLAEGLREIKFFITANPMLNTFATMSIAAEVGQALHGKAGIEQTIYEVVSDVAIFGLMKVLPYLAWGRKEALKKEARKEETINN